MSRWRLAVSIAMGVAFGAGCALADREAAQDTPNPSIPGVDTGTEPEPAYGDDDTPDGGASKKKDSGTSTDAGHSSSDGSTTVAPPDAGPTIPRPTAGEVLITEVMYNPFASEPDAEWFEVRNVASAARTLSGLYIADGGGRTHTIGAGIVIQPGAYALLVRSKTGAVAAKVPDATILYEYGTGLPSNAGILLLNGTTGTVSLHDGSITVSASNYGPWYSQSGGSSVQLKVLDATGASDAAKWCLSFNTWATGSDKGTPGTASDCP